MKLAGVLIEAKAAGQKNESRKQVQLKLAGNSLVVASDNSDQEIFVIDVNSLDFQRGGNRRGLLFLESSLLQGATLYVEFDERSIRFLEGNKIIQKKIGSLTLGLWRENLPALLWLAVFLGSLGAMIFFRGFIFGGLGTMIPFSWEQKVGEKVFTQKLNEKQREVNSELNQLAKKMTFDPGAWSYPFELHISSSSELNAYATLGGHIFVNRGLIQEFTRTEQLLGVLAHEMIHVQRRHVVRSVFQGVGLFVLIQLIFGDFSGLIAIAVDQGGPLLNLQYSRELESEADSRGLQLLVENHVDPRGLPEGLDVMARHMQKLEILNTHPALEKRIADLFSRADQMRVEKKTQEIDFDYLRFKTRVKENF